MVHICSTILLCAGYVASKVAPSWPASIDELEDIMFLQRGYQARAFSAGVTPCSFSQQGPSRIASAEWLRTAFHDMATGSIYTGIGGLDASLVFELGGDGGENIGAGFNTTLETYTPFLSSRSSMADLIAMGVYTAVRSCGGPIIPIRAGRIDATTAGPVGVPQPQNSQGTFINQFLRTGFNTSGMIALTACGHTLGGVHADNFPKILAPGSVAHNYQLLDGTAAFDEKIVTDFVHHVLGNPLTGNLARINSRDADTKVFTADGNVTIRTLTDPTTFRSTCASLLQQMIEVVPSGVVLTDPIVPYEVKPVHLQLSLLDFGENVQFSGQIRGAAAGFDDTFAFYGFSTSLPVSLSISTFLVQIHFSNGVVELHDNNGFLYPVQDTIMLQSAQSCLADATDGSAKKNVTVVAAVRTTDSNMTLAELTLTVHTPRSCCVVPSLTTISIPMAHRQRVGAYDLLTASYLIDASQVAHGRFDLSTGSGATQVVDHFYSIADLGSTCSGGGSNSSTFIYESCIADSVSPRMLTGAATTDTAMTVERCATFCAKYHWFGVEYGTECYCGNTWVPGTNETAQVDCQTPCAGNPSEICGGPLRLSVYRDTTYVAPIHPNITGYHYHGCYSDSRSNRTLYGSFHYANNMTVDACAGFCDGSRYFGLEYYSECYCGNTLSSTAKEEFLTNCSYLCSGDGRQYCGGSDTMDLYEKTGPAS
ncbi:hypothetical protein EYZ11_012008 [Aspergillus tanneri]|uniref:WSC domain-containing protein n=1 Tax=Aspergillus tanneri TaxID=1220188 RepID=A0A4S3J3G4_9EURO|nr:hypothetical protein EYZ11_012008 [Aspergillus tanneri]